MNCTCIPSLHGHHRLCEIVAGPAKPGKAYEEEDDVEDAPVEALVTGGPGSDVGGSVDILSELLLDMTCAVVKLGVLLTEADEKEWKAVRARLNAYRGAAKCLPTAPVARRKLGFAAPPKTKRKVKR